MYTDVIPQDQMAAHATELLKIAHKYDVTDMLVCCESHFSYQVNVQSAVDTLLLADQYGLNKLRACALKFIGTNMSQIALNGESFSRVPHVLLREALVQTTK